MLSFLHKSGALILFILCTFPGALLPKADIDPRFRRLWSLLYLAAFQKGISDTVRGPSRWLWLFQSGCRRWHWLWLPWGCYWKASFSAQRWKGGCCFPRCCWKRHSDRLGDNRSARQVRQEIIHGRCQRWFGQQFVDIVFCPREERLQDRLFLPEASFIPFFRWERFVFFFLVK